MAAEQNDLQRTFPVRKPRAGDNSEYYGIPLRNTRTYTEMQHTGQSQPTSPSNRNARHNYETSRSVPRSYKRHENSQPPDAEKRRDEGNLIFWYKFAVLSPNIRSRFTFLSGEPGASLLRILFVWREGKCWNTKAPKRAARRTWKSSATVSTTVNKCNYCRKAGA